MTSVGVTLRRERERQQRAVSEISEELCITQRYVLALEADDLKSLPGSFFYKSFVRQYAAILSLDPVKLQAGIEMIAGEDTATPLPGADPVYSSRTVDPIVRESNRRYFSDRRVGFSVAGLVAALLACSGVYAWWTKTTQPGSQAQVNRPSGATPLKLPAPAPSQTAQVVAVSESSAPDAINKVVVNVSATEKTWLSIVSDGRQIFSGVLEPTQTKTLRSSEVAKLKVGNAGGVEVRLNGKPLPPIGTRGQVREVVLTPDSYQVLPPKAPNSTLE
jgi:cytoskeleton protein RodZ